MKKNSKKYFKIKFSNTIFCDKEFKIWSNKKRGNTNYLLLIWTENDGLYFKFGKSYGNDSCWETILPKPQSKIKKNE